MQEIGTYNLGYTVYCLIMPVVSCLQFGSEVHRNVHIILLWRAVNLNTKS